MDWNAVLIAFSLTLFAGLATGIGSAIAFLAKTTNTRFLSLSLGFSAGVMIYVSFVEILDKAKIALVGELGESSGTWATIGAFFGGMVIMGIIDRLVPSFENPHEMKQVEEMSTPTVNPKNHKLMRMGIFSAIAIAIHNFPEGIATFMAAMKDPGLGVAIAIAIAIHNIPEGIAVSVPVYYATGSRKKAFKLSFLSGLAEPAGAILAFLVLMPFLSDIVFGVLFASVAGIMVFISIDELLPAAREYGEAHTALYGLILGMAIMAVSLILFIG